MTKITEDQERFIGEFMRRWQPFTQKDSGVFYSQNEEDATDIKVRISMYPHMVLISAEEALHLLNAMRQLSAQSREQEIFHVKKDGDAVQIFGQEATLLFEWLLAQQATLQELHFMQRDWREGV